MFNSLWQFVNDMLITYNFLIILIIILITYYISYQLYITNIIITMPLWWARLLIYHNRLFLEAWYTQRNWTWYLGKCIDIPNIYKSLAWFVISHSIQLLISLVYGMHRAVNPFSRVSVKQNFECYCWCLSLTTIWQFSVTINLE